MYVYVHIIIIVIIVMWVNDLIMKYSLNKLFVSCFKQKINQAE